MTFIKSCSLFFKTKQNPRYLPSLLTTNRNDLQLIYHHPFNQQLFNGTLPPEIFGRYLRDDYFYLNQFSSTIKQLAKHTIKINTDLARQLDYLANDIINNELNMQLQYNEHLQNMTDYIPGPTIVAYTKYLSQTAGNSELSIALCSILPCFWIYHQLGIMHKNSIHLSGNPYKKWIATYSSPDFVTATQHLASTVNLLGEQAPSLIQSQMNDAFKEAVGFELDFFDSVYDKERNLRLSA